MIVSEMQYLTLETLKQIGYGVAAASFNKGLQRLFDDLFDRPTDERKRSVTLELQAVPVPFHDTKLKTVVCTGATVIVLVKAKVPNWETQKIDLSVTNSGQLVFNENSPENAAQKTFLGSEDD